MVVKPIFPDRDVRALSRGQKNRRAAAVCRRGHVREHALGPLSSYRDVESYCSSCGAGVMIACEACGLRIRGVLAIGLSPYGRQTHSRPSFCDGCGGAFPWATRKERILELENLLDEEQIDDADRLVIHDHLRRLMAEGLDEKGEKAEWKGIVARAGSALKSGPVQRVFEGLVNAYLRKELGL
ncbi:DUF2321 domain-containing protein [Jiangella mangrovi]|uniref:DUF2321 domain-containing protein n=1 Tax=Jiangella mangrovi TaxID=1524084 RepID=A0A7W9GXC1_9ACTN|nr:hypothetical protein [Jiangella mangrovi]